MQGGNCSIEGKDDGEDFRRLLSAMDILCFTPEEQNGIYKLLSSVLHLGNIYFQPHQVSLLNTNMHSDSQLNGNDDVGSNNECASAAMSCRLRVRRLRQW